VTRGGYEVEFTSAVRRELKKLPTRVVAAILATTDALAIDPRPAGSIKLTGHDAYRVRTGQLRVIYEVNDQTVTVTVVKVGDRRDVYRNF
jgi:mRNA interferase RelE/StbE